MINGFLFVVFIFMLFMIMKSDINKFVCILFVHLSSISLENFKDRVLIIPEILELIKLHTYNLYTRHHFKTMDLAFSREVNQKGQRNQTIYNLFAGIVAFDM